MASRPLSDVLGSVSAHALVGLALALAPGCVEVPPVQFVDTGPSDPQPDIGPPSPMGDGALPAPDRGVEPPPDQGAAADLGEPADRGVQPDAGASINPGPCPGSCPSPDQIATYVNIERFDAIRVLNDGSIVVAGFSTNALAVDALGPEVRPLERGEALPQLREAGQGDAVLLRLDDDLQAIGSITRLPRDRLGPIKSMQLTDGRDEADDLLLAADFTGGVDGEEPGLVILKVTAPRRGAGSQMQHQIAVEVSDGYRRQPFLGSADDGLLFFAVGSPQSPLNELQAVRPGSGRAVIPSWRHHRLESGETHLGTTATAPGGVGESRLPLRFEDQCTLRTWRGEPGAASFGVDIGDGNGGVLVGPAPFDAYFGGVCEDPSAPLDREGPVGLNLTRLVGGFAVAALTVDRRNGRLYLALQAESDVPEGGSRDQVPTLIAFDPGGEISWWRHLHPGGLAEDGVVRARTSSEGQAITGLAIDYENDELVVAAQTTLTSPELALWGAVAGEPGFQRRPPEPNPPGAAIGWLGRLALATGDARAVTHVYAHDGDLAAEPTRAGRLRCFVDTEAAQGLVPQTTPFSPGLIRVGPQGQVAVVMHANTLESTPDALLPGPAPTGRPALTATTTVRIYSADLRTVLYSTRIGTIPEGGAIGDAISGEILVNDLDFTADGELLVVGHQRAGVGALPTANVPPWGVAEWARRANVPTQAVFLRLVPRPECGAE